MLPVSLSQRLVYRKRRIIFVSS